jgi:hypothetical protein
MTRKKLYKFFSGKRHFLLICWFVLKPKWNRFEPKNLAEAWDRCQFLPFSDHNIICLKSFCPNSNLFILFVTIMKYFISNVTICDILIARYLHVFQWNKNVCRVILFDILRRLYFKIRCGTISVQEEKNVGI